METQRIMSTEAELDAFGQASLSNWVCLCTLAELPTNSSFTIATFASIRKSGILMRRSNT